MKTYSVGLVGLGRIASLYEKDAKARRFYPALTHAGSYARNPRTRMVCACDRNPARLRQFGRRWGVAALYGDVRKMLRNHRLDILSVCATPEAHWPVIREAAGRVPLIFCEKPMGNGLEQARRIQELCRRKGTRLAVNLYRLFDPSHREVGRKLRNGEIGAVQRVNCFYGKGLRNMGSHLISLLLEYFGPIKAVRAWRFRSLGDVAEPTADFLARFASGASCAAQGCDFRNYRIFEMDVLGKKGRLVLEREGFAFRLYRAGANRAESGARELWPKPFPVRSTVGRALSFAVSHLVDCLDRGRAPWSSGKDYLATEEVVEAVTRSARTDKWVRVEGTA